MSKQTNKAASAARIWDEIEHALIESGLPPDRFTVPRAKMIRVIGEALRGKREPPKVALKPEVPVMVALPSHVATGKRMVREHNQAVVDAINTRLNQLIERSIHGYQGDDEV